MLVEMKFIMGDKLTVVDFCVGAIFFYRCGNEEEILELDVKLEYSFIVFEPVFT